MLGAYAKPAAGFTNVEELCCNLGSHHGPYVRVCRMRLDYYDTHQLRDYAAERLNLEDVPGPLWNKNILRLFIDHWDRGSPSVRADMQERLVDTIREDLEAIRELDGDIAPWTLPRETRQTSIEAPAQSDDPKSLRAWALCVYWAKLAEREESLRSFRANVTEGATVSDVDARRLLDSPAASLVGVRTFAKHGVPIVGHTSQLEVSERSHPLDQRYNFYGTLHLAWPGGAEVTEFKNSGPAPPTPMEVWNGIETIVIAPWLSAVLGDLRKTASKLTERYPWDISIAAWFVLTGEPPWVPPLTGRAQGPDSIRNHGTITIKASHWVPEEDVAALYSYLKARTKPAPTTSRRRLTLFCFVTERSSPITERLTTGIDPPPWRSLQSQWNEQYPTDHKWHYQDIRNFRRDFLEAWRSLTVPEPYR